MPPAPTRSSNKSVNKLPFTVKTIAKYEPFQALEPKVKAKICELLTSGMVSPKGNIKRPPNSFMLYRQTRLSELTKPNESELSETLKPKPSIVKSEWNGSEVEKAEYSRLAKRAQQEHDAKFPGYKYTPIPERKWKAISEEGRKKWFFEFLSLVSTNIVRGYSSAKPGGLDIDDWIRDPTNHVYVSDQVLDEVLSNAKPTSRILRASAGHPSTQTDQNRSGRDISPRDNSLDFRGSNDGGILSECMNSTLSSPSGTVAYLGPLSLAQSLSISQPTHVTHYQSRAFQNQIDFMDTNGESEDLVDYIPPATGEVFALEERTLWNANNPEIRNLCSGRDSYNPSQTWAPVHSVVTESETAIDYAFMSQQSGQDGTFSSDYTDSNAEHLYDCSELMKQFLNPFVLEDTHES